MMIRRQVHDKSPISAARHSLRMNLINQLAMGSGIRRNMRFAAHVLRERKAVERAAKRMPKPVPWDWARPRLFPLLAGPAFDDAEAPTVRTTAGPGCAIEFGMDIGGPHLIVDAMVAERWECSAAQLRDVAVANLRRRIADLTPGSMGRGVFSGRMVRMFRGPRYAASLVLIQDELERLFGSHDQVFATPSQRFLISFPIDTPDAVLADTVVDLELAEPLPLLYDPFVLHDGRLFWQPAAADAEEEDNPRWTS